MSCRLAFLALVLAFALASLAHAAEHTGETLRLRAGGITAGASVFLQPADGASPYIDSAGATLPAQPLGSSSGPTREVAAGPWPILTVSPVTPLPEPGFAVSLFAGGTLLALLARRRSASSV